MGSAVNQSWSDGGPIELPVTLRLSEVHHFLGYPERHDPSFRMKTVIEQTIEEARHLIRPRGVARLVELERAAEIALTVTPAQSEATGLALGLVTIGRDLEARATEYQRQGLVTQALVLDAAGSAAVEEAADRLNLHIVGGDMDDLVDESVPCRVSPGYGEWPIEAQRELFELLPAEELGVELAPTLLMVPRKSVSFAIWLGADVDGARGCAACDLERCPSRRR